MKTIKLNPKFVDKYFRDMVERLWPFFKFSREWQAESRRRAKNIILDA